MLLDDVFDKLDQDRVALIMQLVESDHFGQIFLSDTHQERTLAALETTQLSYSLFRTIKLFVLWNHETKHLVLSLFYPWV